jgi:ABC-type transporter Mla MlaB component
MAGRQPGDGPGERAWHNGDAPAARATAGGSVSVLDGGENFSIARRSGPAELALAGEFDICSVPGLTVALSDAVDGAGALHLDLAGVHFCDLAALQAITSLTQAGDHQQHPATPVVLHHCPAQVEKLLRLTGWDTLAGLTVDTGGTTLRAVS